MHSLLVWQALWASLGATLVVPVLLVAASLFAVGVALVLAPRARGWRARSLALAPAVLLTANAIGLTVALLHYEAQRIAGLTSYGPAHAPSAGAEAWLSLLATVLTFAVPGLVLAGSRMARRAASRAALQTGATGALVCGVLVACAAAL